MQKPYNRKQEQICVIYCPSCKGAVAACKESAKDTSPAAINETAPEGFSTFQPQSFNQQVAFYVARGYKKCKVNETVAKKVQDVKDGKAIQDPPIKVCNCKKQNT